MKDTGDTITDFKHSSDAGKIDRMLSTRARWPGVGHQDGFTAANQVSWYEDGGNTIVQVNTDANLGTAELVITLTGTGLNLAATDFVL